MSRDDYMTARRKTFKTFIPITSKNAASGMALDTIRIAVENKTGVSLWNKSALGTIRIKRIKKEFPRTRLLMEISGLRSMRDKSAPNVIRVMLATNYIMQFVQTQSRHININFTKSISPLKKSDFQNPRN